MSSPGKLVCDLEGARVATTHPTLAGRVIFQYGRCIGTRRSSQDLAGQHAAGDGDTRTFNKITASDLAIHPQVAIFGH